VLGGGCGGCFVHGGAGDGGGSAGGESEDAAGVAEVMFLGDHDFSWEGKTAELQRVFYVGGAGLTSEIGGFGYDEWGHAGQCC